MNLPNYWKTELGDIKDAVEAVHIGKRERLCKSAGGRDIDLIYYGLENNIQRKANLSSALGAMDKSAYADKARAGYRPTLLLVGGIHGGEFEGTAAILNLISLLEQGCDFAGRKRPALTELIKQVNLVLIPCINPDGRSRVPFQSMVGESLETLRYYSQGTWVDGSLCGWPGCKLRHPIKEYVSYLGGYFNDDGINLMHDNFFGKMAEETRSLLDIADRHVPDLTILLHGGINGDDHILKPAYSPLYIKKRISELEKRMRFRCMAAGVRYSETELDRGENREPPASFNLCSAICHLCGEPCITFESNQGLSYDGAMLYEEIYEGHMILFEESSRFILERSDVHGI